MVEAVIIGVGGFLGMGEKNVAVSMDALKWIVAEDNTERYVLETTKEALSNAPAFEWTEDAPAMADANNTMATDPNAMAPAADQTAMAPADNAMAPADNTATGTVSTDTAAAPAAGTRMDPLVRDGMTDFDEAQLTAEELIGTNVYGTNDEHIGAIGDLALNEDGSVDAIVIDFGGFLGIGTKPVAVSIENLRYATDANSNKYLFVNVTRDQLDKAPAYDANTFEADRNAQYLRTTAN